MSASAVRRTLHELSVMKHIGEENIVGNFDAAVREGIDYIGEQFLGQDIGPKQGKASSAPAMNHVFCYIKYPFA